MFGRTFHVGLEYVDSTRMSILWLKLNIFLLGSQFISKL